MDNGITTRLHQQGSVKTYKIKIDMRTTLKAYSENILTLSLLS
jgi:hypothetical protein